MTILLQRQLGERECSLLSCQEGDEQDPSESGVELKLENHQTLKRLDQI